MIDLSSADAALREECTQSHELLRGRLLLEKGDWEAALKALELLPEDYEGRAGLEQDCREAQAFTL